MKINLLLIGICLLVRATSPSATIINVPADQPTIQQGIQSSADGDTVLVSPGEYHGNVVFEGRNITLASLYLTTDDTAYIRSTIIDADLSGSVIILNDGEDSTAAIIGLTIRNGYTFYNGGGISCDGAEPVISHNIITGNAAGNGGGIYCYNADPIITDNRINGNRSHYVHPFGEGAGGGIYCEEANPLISNNVISEDTARFGGGIYCYNASPAITQNVINADTANYGGAIYLDNSEAQISDNELTNNSSANAGGGIFCHQAGPVIINNTVSGNHADNGGGIYCEENSEPGLNHNAINANTARISGGGIYCNGADPRITNNTINQNAAEFGGGACFEYGSQAELSFNNIENNSANSGAGIAVDSHSHPRIRDNTINGNSAITGGGGIACFNSSLNIISNRLTGNSAYNGGGLYCIFSNVTIGKCVLTDNQAYHGGGFFCGDSSTAIVSNAVFSGNTAIASGGGISCWNSYPLIRNSILWNDSAPNNTEIDIDYDALATVIYCDIEDGFPGDGNFNADPLFRNPANDDYHLSATVCGDSFDSPCIDAGDPGIEDDSLDCDFGLGMLTSDVGAYGGGEPHVGIINDSSSPLPKNAVLLPNYPNPFNARTIISYDLPKPCSVTLDIYDILGRRVQTLLNINQPAGTHRVTWNGDAYSSGIYFYKLTAGDYTQTRKMLLVK